MPDTEDFQDGNWSLGVVSLNLDALKNRIATIALKIALGDTDDMPRMAQEIAKLSSAKLDENGMMSIVSYVASDNMTVYYIVETGDKRRRLFDKVAQDLLAKGKATIITPAAFDEMVQTKKDAEKALIGEGITKAAFEIAIKAEEAMAKAA